MKRYLLALLVPLAFTPWPSANPAEYAGTTPCDAAPRQFLSISRAASCERITWRLDLSTPNTFTLRATYGMQARNRPDFENGGTTTRLTGTWSIVERGGKHTYRLVTANPAHVLDLRRIGEALLHLVAERGSLMVGNGGWGYALNRRGADAAPGAPMRLRPARTARRDPQARSTAGRRVVGSRVSSVLIATRTARS